MELTYTLDQLKVYVNNENVKEYFFSNFGLSPEEVLSQIESTLSKRTYFNEYYQKRKNDQNAYQKIKDNNANWYHKNKIRIAALQRSKYADDPDFKKWYQQYQAVYAQKRRNIIGNERNIGRPRKYNIVT